MFGNILKKINKVVDETEQIDDRFYAEVIDELGQGFKDKAAVGKAIAQCDGDGTKFDSLYMKIRASALKDKYLLDSKKKRLEQKIEQEKYNSFKSNIKFRYQQGYFEKLFKNEIKNLGYSRPFLLHGTHDFKKNDKNYIGKINYEKMKYVLADENNEYVDSFSFDEVKS